MPRSPRYIALALTLALAPRTLAAQDPPLRLRVAALYDSLTVTDELARIKELGRAWRKQEDGDAQELGAALVAWRRGTVAGKAGSIRDAMRRFDYLVAGHGDWPWPRFGLALAALQVYREGYPMPLTYGGKLGGVHYHGYADQLRQLFEREPTFAPALEFLLAQVGNEPEHELPDELVTALEQVALVPDVDPRLHLALARATRIRGHLAASEAHLDQLRASGFDASLESYERARTLAAGGQLVDAAQHYLNAAVQPSPAGRSRLRDDMEWIARPAELAAFDSASDADLSQLVQDFWARRDAAELREYGERLREHLYRVAHADKYFRITFPVLRSNIRRVQLFDNAPCKVGEKMSLDDYDFPDPSRSTGWRQRERVYDHRAIVYIRHGEPLYRFGAGMGTDEIPQEPLVPTPAGGEALGAAGARDVASPQPLANRGDHALAAPSFAYAPPGVSSSAPENFFGTAIWVYLFEGEVRIFRFDPSDFGQLQPTALTVNAFPLSPSMMLALAPYLPDAMRLYSLMSFPSRAVPSNALRCRVPQMVERAQQDAAVAVRTDSYTRRFREQLDAAIRLYAMGQPAQGTGELLAVVAVPARDAGPNLRFDVAVVDTLTGQVTRAQRDLDAAPSTVQQGSLLANVLAIPLPDGRTSVRVALSRGDRDRGMLAMASIAPAPAGFGLSDIITGRDDAGLVWYRHGRPVRLNPLDRYEPGSVVTMYYELYGTAPGASYRTTIALYKISERKNPLAALSFDDVGDGSELRFERRLSLDRIREGDYRLVISVTDGGGVSRTRERPLFVRRKE